MPPNFREVDVDGLEEHPQSKAVPVPVVDEKSDSRGSSFCNNYLEHTWWNAAFILYVLINIFLFGIWLGFCRSPAWHHDWAKEVTNVTAANYAPGWANQHLYEVTSFVWVTEFVVLLIIVFLWVMMLRKERRITDWSSRWGWTRLVKIGLLTAILILAIIYYTKAKSAQPPAVKALTSGGHTGVDWFGIMSFGPPSVLLVVDLLMLWLYPIRPTFSWSICLPQRDETSLA